jgi:hypothetical protein
VRSCHEQPLNSIQLPGYLFGDRVDGCAAQRAQRSFSLGARRTSKPATRLRGSASAAGALPSGRSKGRVRLDCAPEQVLQKQAQQDLEKARRHQEAREELELLVGSTNPLCCEGWLPCHCSQQERERATATRKLQPQQEQTAIDPSPPAPSPQRAVSVPMMPGAGLQQQISPLQSSSVGAGFTNSSNTGTSQGAVATESAQHNAAPTPATSLGSESYTPAFSSAPSIFEALLREPGIGARSSSFYDDLAALQRLAVEVRKVRVLDPNGART